MHGITSSSRAGATQARINFGGFTSTVPWTAASNVRVLTRTLTADNAQTVFDNLSADQDTTLITADFHNAASQQVGNALHFRLHFADSPVSALTDRVESLEERNPTALTALPFNAALAIDWDDGLARSVTLTGNTTITFSNVSPMEVFVLEVTQDSTGSRTITWPASVEWAGGSAEGPSSGGGDVDVYTLLALSSSRIVASALLDVS